MIFVDRSIPRGVANALKEVRADVVWLEDLFPHDVKDEDWLREAGRQGWLVISRDKKIRTRPGERRAYMGASCRRVLSHVEGQPHTLGAIEARRLDARRDGAHLRINTPPVSL